jgi:protein gp37
MADNTKISWAHHTLNLWHGCTKQSPACEHCYAETWDSRKLYEDVTHWGPTTSRWFRDIEKCRADALKWNLDAEKAGERRRVFCMSMGDIFEVQGDEDIARQQRDARASLGKTIRETPWLDWLLLTKLPGNWVECLYQMDILADTQPGSDHSVNMPRNLWVGVTAENQEWADKRIPELLKIPCAGHFVSCEPLLGPLDLTHITDTSLDGAVVTTNTLQGKCTLDRGHPRRQIDWVIAGCESGHGRRTTKINRYRKLRDQCIAAGIPFHLKQADFGEGVEHTPKLDGQVWAQFPEAMEARVWE